MNGDLAEGVVPDLLREIYVGRRNGVLTLARGEERQSLTFSRGHIVNSRTNVLEERLGEMLVRRGLLTSEGLARATEVVVREKRRLGEVLAELGLMDQVRLEDAIALHVHEMLAKVFAWLEGTYSFEDEAGAGPGQEVRLKLSTGELILEAVRAVQDPDVVRYALGDIDRVLALSSDPLLRFQYPAAREDVRRAILYLEQNGASLGIDPSRLVLVGRSAGAHLALLSAYADRDPAIRGVVGLYPPVDLRWAYAHPSNPRVLNSTRVLEEILGGSPEATGNRYDEASPLSYVDSGTPPTLLIHGEGDELVFTENVRRLDARLAATTRPHVFITLPWATHVCDYFIAGPCGQIVTYEVERFVAAVTR